MAGIIWSVCGFCGSGRIQCWGTFPTVSSAAVQPWCFNSWESSQCTGAQVFLPAQAKCEGQCSTAFPRMSASIRTIQKLTQGNTEKEGKEKESKRVVMTFCLYMCVWQEAVACYHGHEPNTSSLSCYLSFSLLLTSVYTVVKRVSHFEMHNLVLCCFFSSVSPPPHICAFACSFWFYLPPLLFSVSLLWLCLSFSFLSSPSSLPLSSCTSLISLLSSSLSRLYSFCFSPAVSCLLLLYTHMHTSAHLCACPWQCGGVASLTLNIKEEFCRHG